MSIVTVDPGNNDEVVHFMRIPMEEYVELIKAKVRLELLEAGGVDNWDWFDESLKDLDEKIAEAMRFAGIPKEFIE